MVIGLVPLGKNRHRAYFIYPKTTGYRLQGAEMLQRFLQESAKCYPPLADYYTNAKCIGPLASFEVNDSCAEHPFTNGLALLGDAASTTDPTFGQGLSVAL